MLLRITNKDFKKYVCLGLLYLKNAVRPKHRYRYRDRFSKPHAQF